MLVRRVERFLKTYRVPCGASLLAGFSGGPDSTCLVSILHRLSASYQFTLACAYFDHGIRPAAERSEEAARITEFCRTRKIPLFVSACGEGELVKEAAGAHGSLEAAARRARFRFFNSLRREQGFDRLLLAHTLDDQLETILWRLFQGSGAAGVRGIRARRGWLLRPLLGTTRIEILDYLKAEGLPYSIDSTNAENRFLRNRIRNELLPVARRIFPGLGRSLLAYAAKMAEIDDYLRSQADGAFVWKKTGQGWKTEAGRFFSSPPALRMYALYHQADRLKRGRGVGGAGTIPYRFIAPLLTRSAGSLTKIDLRGFGLSVRRERGWLFLERYIVADTKKGYFIDVIEEQPFVLCDRWCVVRGPGRSKRRAEELLCAFAAEKVEPPFVIRSRKAGDRIEMGFGKKRLKKLFNEWGLSGVEKDMIPVLVDGKGILAVLGALCGCKNIIRYGAHAGAVDGRRNMSGAVRLYEMKRNAEEQ